MTPEGWRDLTLGDIVVSGDGLQTGPFGAQLHASDYSAEGVPVVMPKDIARGRIHELEIARVPNETAARLSQYRVRANDVLFGRRGEMGRCAIVSAEQVGWLCGTGCLRARPDPAIAQSDFLRHALAWGDTVQWLTDNAVGQTMLNLNTAILARLPLRLPSTSEQRKIAAILSSVDEAIEATQGVIDQLGVVKKAMMAELLTRGLPGRHTKFRQTEIGEVPHGWSLVGLLDLVDLPASQVDPRVSPYREMPLVAPNHIESGAGRIISVETAASQNAISGKYPFESGDVLYSKIRPYLRKAWIAEFDGICSADMYPLRVNGADARFLLAVLLGDEFSSYAASVSARTGIPKINRDELSGFRVRCPSLDEQREIGLALAAVSARASTEGAFAAQLDSLKTALMSVLLTGELRVKPDEDAP
jgi:type I restriction enzyme S subunit